MADPRTALAEALRQDIRKAITDAYYEARDHGETMEKAADIATADVMLVIERGYTIVASDRLAGLEQAGRTVRDVSEWSALNGDPLLDDDTLAALDGAALSRSEATGKGAG